MSEKFKFNGLNVHQKHAITSMLQEKDDAFVSLPTGYGKSVIYQALPLAFDEYTRKTGQHCRRNLASSYTYRRSDSKLEDTSNKSYKS